MDNTIDNQQRRLCDLSWLGGMIDGEGMVTVMKRSDGYSFVPRISISNTDELIIEACVNIFREEKLPYYVQSKAYKINNQKRIKFEILVSGMKRCEKILPIIIPYVKGKKKDNAIKLLDWIKYRKKSPKKKYTEIDNEILSIRKSHLIRSQTTR